MSTKCECKKEQIEQDQRDNLVSPIRAVCPVRPIRPVRPVRPRTVVILAPTALVLYTQLNILLGQRLYEKYFITIEFVHLRYIVQAFIV